MTYYDEGINSNRSLKGQHMEDIKDIVMDEDDNYDENSLTVSKNVVESSRNQHQRVRLKSSLGKLLSVRHVSKKIQQ